MLFHLLPGLSNQIGFLNVFKYLTFRTGGAILTSLLISFIFGSSFINWLKSIQKNGQPIRENGPEGHLLTKKGTPTMGGVLVLISLTISTLLWGNLTNVYLWTVLFITLGFGLIGAYDDYLKLTKQSSNGLSGKHKLILQGLMTLIATYFIVNQGKSGFSTSVAFPFIKDYLLDLGVFFYVFSFFVIVGASNAVNLTDGLDGLAIVPIVLACSCFALISYLVGNSVFANYLQIQHVPDVGELSVFCGAMIGAGLGFLWYNAPPAKVFMGDTGSLAAGGALGVTSVITKHEIVLAIIGGLFVLEAISVILQVGYYKLTKRRIFLMAPIHHHFEKKGWAEATIVIRFWIIAMILALIGLSTLKLR
ncbi:phospho-N-acetylmuramoyl-pentapeptide-transferase [Candidatus Odyssella acanthamoebae]|uniref:Phospho-N-acetylmuramoyl-pentapeptide-transferase n=1 Tax=Candidatus Odyssella acanthamoebae TaxID=91604 RepID=A0A077ARQ5_9PROT|nr:phospho-N-acetylmuramoyl-pentapeptide-transferase [Candidatus Paracaedibacter acanthamoebae]AIK95877.1 phospho-N-acetylmuramoyl-pentapeptide-transferase [Candidatus Paracaedibacter acanthamoebae]